MPDRPPRHHEPPPARPVQPKPHARYPLDPMTAATADLADAVRELAAALRPEVRTVNTETPSREPRPRRLRECVERWPDCVTGEFNPLCCRWPKSCSADIYDPATVSIADLETDRTYTP